MKTDKRYSIHKEFTGTPNGPHYVARFAGERIGEAATLAEARIMATSHAFHRAADGLTDLRVIPAMDYRLAGIESSRLSRRTVYPATVASNQPDHVKREAVFVGDILLERGEYFAVSAGSHRAPAFPITLIGDPEHAAKQSALVRNLTTRPAWKLADCDHNP